MMASPNSIPTCSENLVGDMKMMASPVGISACLESFHVKKNSLQKALLRLAVEWKDLDKHLDSTKGYLNNSLTDLESKHKDLETNRNSIAESSKELDSVPESLTLRLEELDCREEKFRCYKEAQIEELEAKEKELSATRIWVKERAEEFESREERLGEQEKSMELLLEKFDTEKKDLLDIEQSLGKKMNEITMKERQCEDRIKELDSWEKQVELREEKLEKIQKVSEEQCSELENKVQHCYKELDTMRDMIEGRAKELDAREQQVEMREQQFEAIIFNEDHLKELEIKVKNPYIVLNTIQNLTEKRAKELDLRENQFVLKEEQFKALQKTNEEKCKELEIRVQDRYRELDSIRYLIEGRQKELGAREKQIEVKKLEAAQNFSQEHCEEVQMKSLDEPGELDLPQELMETRDKDPDLKEEQVYLKEKQLLDIPKLDEHHKELETEYVYPTEKQLIDISKLDEHHKELETGYVYPKEKQLIDIPNLDEHHKELETEYVYPKEKQPIDMPKLDEHHEELETEYVYPKEKQLIDIPKLDEHRKELETEEQELDSAQILYKELPQKPETKKQQLKFVWKSTKNSINGPHSKNKKTEATRKLFESTKEFESEKKQPEEQSEKNLLNGKLLGDVGDSQVEVKHVDNTPTTNLLAESKAPVKMNGRTLQAYLNEHIHIKDHGSLSDEVNKILKSSSDPAMLVLDAMEGLYPPLLKKGNVEFKASVIRRSCILLLEQIMLLSPLIRSHVKEEALKIAGEWKLKSEESPKDHLMVLAFFKLFASFKLASEFETDEILDLLVYIPLGKWVPEFCRSLGLLQEKVSDFIKRLVERGMHLDAIKYVSAFDVSDEFLPATLLKGYIAYEQEAVEKLRKEAHYSLEAQGIATRKELNSLNSVIKCIRLHKLESYYPIKDLNARAGQVERQMIDIKRFASSSLSTKVFPEEKLNFHMERIGTNNKKRKCLLPEHATDSQPHSLEIANQHPPSIFPVPLPPHHVPQCSRGPTFDPQYMSYDGPGDQFNPGFSPSGYGDRWSVAWP